jgi:hypothetical protein
MGGELKGFCTNNKWLKICPSAIVLCVAQDDGCANDMSVMQADNSWEWMCPIVFLDVCSGTNIQPFVFLTSSTQKWELEIIPLWLFPLRVITDKHEFSETQQFVVQFSYLYVGRGCRQSFFLQVVIIRRAHKLFLFYCTINFNIYRALVLYTTTLRQLSNVCLFQ